MRVDMSEARIFVGTFPERSLSVGISPGVIVVKETFTPLRSTEHKTPGEASLHYLRCTETTRERQPVFEITYSVISASEAANLITTLLKSYVDVSPSTPPAGPD